MVGQWLTADEQRAWRAYLRGNAAEGPAEPAAAGQVVRA